MRTIFKTVYILFIIVAVSYGQRFLVHTYTVEKGLPSNFVNSLVQDKNGYMWFLTNNGIASYNGQQWKIFTSRDGLEATHYKYAHIDSMNNVWAAPSTFEHHIMYFNGEKWLVIPSPDLGTEKGAILTDMAVSAENPARNGIAVGTERHGFFVFKNGKWHQFTQAGGKALNHINSVFPYRPGSFLVSTDKSVFLYNNGRLKPLENVNRLLGDKTIYKSTLDHPQNSPDMKFWIVGKKFVAKSSLDSLEFLDLPASMMWPNNITSLLSWDYNRLFIGAHSGLFVLDIKAKTIWPITKDNGLIATGTNCLAADFERNIWVACDRGVSKLVSRRFETYRAIDGLLEDEVTAVNEMPNGFMVLGHTKGFTVIDRNKNKKYILKLPGKTGVSGVRGRILDMVRGQDGNIYAVSHLTGLYRIDSKIRLKRIWLPKSINAEIACLAADEDGLWLGSGSTIYKVDYNGNVKLRIIPGDKAYIRRLFTGENSELIVASKSAGLMKISPGNYKKITSASDLYSRNIFAYFKQEDGTELVGGINGIYVISGDSLLKLRPGGDAFNRPVFFIRSDKAGNIWLGTDNGVYKWNKHEFRNYSFKHGLAGFETNRAGGFVDSRGQLWVGTENGVSVYHAEFDELNLPPPILAIRNMEASGIMLKLKQKEIRVSSAQNSLDFGVDCISFLNENDIQVKFRLKGFETDYRIDKFSPGLRFQYPNLQPGEYQFEIIAKNTNGTLSEPVFSPVITISKPYYSEWWFYLLMGVILFFIIKLIIKIYTQQVYSHRLEEEVKHRTQLLWDTETRYKTLFQESKDAVLILDGNGKLLDINQAGVDLLGFESKEEMLTTFHLDEFVLSHEIRDNFYSELIENGAVKDFEIQFKNLHGQVLQTLVTAISKKSEDNKLLEIRGIIRDESRRRELEKQVLHAQKMESVGTLAGGIAHDFNNILAGMLGYTSLIKLKFPDRELIDEFIEPIEMGASRASELTSQLLAFARGGKYDVKPIGLNYIIKDVVKIIQSTFPKNIDIITDLYGYLPTIEADPSQIQQVIMNLCVNARDAMPDGGTLTIKTDLLILAERGRSLFKDLNPGKYVHITISDTGTGISPEIMDKIFEPFFTTKDSGKGTGLGLSMVYGVVRNHEGSIDVTSKPGKGTSFEIAFPVSNESLEAEEEEQIPNHGDETILLVDDEEDIRGVLKTALEMFGYKVILAENGLEAIKVFSDKMDEIDLIIMDIMMPKMSGDEAITIIKEMKPDIKIMIASGFLPDAKVKKLFANTEKIFIQKPFKANVILSKIREILDESPVNNAR